MPSGEITNGRSCYTTTGASATNSNDARSRCSATAAAPTTAQRTTLTVATNRVEAKPHFVADWCRHARSDTATTAMIAYGRADFTELNSVARALLDHD